MAIGNFNGSTVGLRAITTTTDFDFLNGAIPFTISAWIYPGAIGTWTAASIARNSTNRFADISTRNDTNQVWFIGHTNAATGRFLPRTNTNGSGFALNQWQLVAGGLDNVGGITAGWADFGRIYSSANDSITTSAQVDDMNVGTAYWERMGIGHRRTSAAANFAPTGSLIAEVAFWNVLLSEDEMRALGKGMKPSQIRPDNLKIYVPGIRNITQDVVSGRILVDHSGTTFCTAQEHVRRYG